MIDLLDWWINNECSHNQEDASTTTEHTETLRFAHFDYRARL